MALDFPAPPFEGQTFASDGATFIYHNGRWMHLGSPSGGGGGGGGIVEIVEDTSPQLGGDLDPNGFVILTMVPGVDLQPYSDVLANTTASFTTADETKLDTLPDNAALNALLALKANVDNAVLTGVPTVPDLLAGTSSSQAVNAKFVMDSIAGYAPGGGGLDNMVEDTSPQLGGDLDRNGFQVLGLVPGTDIQPYSAVLAATTASFLIADEVKLDALPTNAALNALLAAKAPLDAPVFTGDARAVTPATADNDTSIATTAFVKAQNYAPLASPTFTGAPKAPTVAVSTNDTSIATTAAVTTALNAYAPLAGPLFTGDPRAPTPAPGDNDTSLATTAFVTAADTALLLPARLNPAMQTGFDTLIAAGSAATDAMSDSLNTLVNMSGSVTLLPATQAQMWSQPDGLYMVTPQAQREQWQTVALSVVGGNCSIDGALFQHGTVAASSSDVAFTSASGLTQDAVVVDVAASGATRTVTAPAFENKTNIGTAGIPVPNGVTARFHMTSDGSTKTCRFIGYSDRGWAPTADTRLAYDANRLPVLLTAAQEMTALLATATFKAKNVAVVELALGTDFTSNITTGDGKDYFTIPQALNGWKLTRAQVSLVTAGTGGGPMTVQVHNKSGAVDVLSTPVSIAAGALAGTVGTINASNNTATTDHVWRADVDAVHTTAAKGGILVMEFTEP